jgi:two-component system NtrC family response regulator
MEPKPTQVLLVDDQTEFIQPMSFWLKSKGYAVRIAFNGEDAIKILQADKPDIVFLDLNMPKMDGLEALKRIRQFNKDLPIIIISAYVDDSRIIEARNYGVSGVFYKGKNFETSLTLLEAALKTHRELKK